MLVEEEDDDHSFLNEINNNNGFAGINNHLQFNGNNPLYYQIEHIKNHNKQSINI